MENNKFNATSAQEQFLQVKKADELADDIGGDLYTAGSVSMGTNVKPTVKLTGKYMFVIQYLVSNVQKLQVGAADETHAIAFGGPDSMFNPININSFMCGNGTATNVNIMRFKLK